MDHMDIATITATGSAINQAIGFTPRAATLVNKTAGLVFHWNGIAGNYTALSNGTTTTTNGFTAYSTAPNIQGLTLGSGVCGSENDVMYLTSHR